MKYSAAFHLVTGLSGIGFAAVIFLVNMIILVPAGEPAPGSDVGAIVDFYGAEDGAVTLASMFLPVSWFAATLFGVGAVSAARGAERERSEAWSLAGLAGILLQNGTFAVLSAVRITLAETGGSVAPEALAVFHDALLLLNGTFLALALTGLSIAGLRSGVVRRWQASVGFCAAVLQFASAVLAPLVLEHGGALGYIGLAGWLLWVVWLVCYGIALMRFGKRRSLGRA